MIRDLRLFVEEPKSDEPKPPLLPPVKEDE